MLQNNDAIIDDKLFIKIILLCKEICSKSIKIKKKEYNKCQEFKYEITWVVK